MLWGAPFQTVHLITLAVAAALIVGLYFLLKYLPDNSSPARVSRRFRIYSPTPMPHSAPKIR